MDAYEATRVVFSRIQSLDPENAAKIMGLLLLQDHGEKEMIRLAFGPETLLHSIISKARKDLGLLPPSSAPTTPSGCSSPYLLSRQNSSSNSRFLAGGVLPPPPLTVSSPSWAPPPSFNGVSDDLHSPDELISPSNPPLSSPFRSAGGDLVDELQLQDQLSFLNDPTTATGECRSPSSNGDSMLYSYMGWGANGHRRSSSAASAELCFGSDSAGGGLGWRPCLYYARGYCKNGNSCRFMHGLPDDTATVAAGMDALVEQQCQELLLRSKSPRLAGGAAASQLMASAFPFSPTGSVPLSPPSRCLSFLQSDSQRAAAAALLLGGDDPHKFMGRSRLERSDFANMANPGSRQIYLTFPADSTFREEDVSNYFSIYGPVQDVRIPYQQKRMFGFVTFVYPETVKLILAKGNPHFVCDARVLVKPYKEKGKVPDKYRKQQPPSERGDYSGCSTPTGLDPRDPFELQQLGARMLYNQEALLRRKIQEQQQAAELQHAIEFQGRRFMGLQLLDLKSRSAAGLSSPTAAHINAVTIAPPATNTSSALADPQSDLNKNQQETQPEGESACTGRTASGAKAAQEVVAEQHMNNNSGSNGKTVNAVANKEDSGAEPKRNEDSDLQESAEHNLPDSPFASPTKACFDDTFAVERSTVDSPHGGFAGGNGNGLGSSPMLPSTSSFNPSFFSMPRFSFDHGAIGM